MKDYDSEACFPVINCAPIQWLTFTCQKRNTLFPGPPGRWKVTSTFSSEVAWFSTLEADRCKACRNKYSNPLPSCPLHNLLIVPKASRDGTARLEKPLWTSVYSLLYVLGKTDSVCMTQLCRKMASAGKPKVVFSDSSANYWRQRNRSWVFWSRKYCFGLAFGGDGWH